MKNLSRSTAVAFFVVAFIAGGLLPPAITNASSASLNTFNADQDTTQISNATASPGCAECWKSSISGVRDNDIVAILVYYHNTGPDTAENVRVRVQPTGVNSNNVTFSGRVWADNAGASSKSVTATMASGEKAQSVEFVDASWYPNRTLSNPTDVGSAVTQATGYNIGDVTFSWGTTGTVVVRFRISTEDDNDDNNDDGGDEPQVETRSAEDIEDDRAELVCRVENGDEDADVWFEWGESRSRLNKDTSKTSVDANENTTVRKTITRLDEDTRYYFRCVAEDDDGNEDRGSVKNFRTDGGSSGSGDQPDVVTLSATGVDSASATLRGEVDPNGDDTDAWFEWGTSSSNLNRTTSKQDMGDGTRDVFFNTGISGLSANTTYYFRAVAENDEGRDRGNILNFRTGSPVVNVVTRFIDVVRRIEVEPEPEVEALIITLNANAVDIDRRVIDYTVSYDNRTDLFLTNSVLTVNLPRELNFVDATPNPSRESEDQLVFNIGRIEAGEQGSFLIETRLDSSFNENDEIRFVATMEYNDDGSARKVVEVIDESTFGEIAGGGGAFTAAIADAFRGLFTNPLLWIILFILLVFFAVRYMLAARDKKADTLV